MEVIPDRHLHLVDDDVLNTFAVVGELEEVPTLLTGRFGDVIDRVSFYAPYPMSRERWRQVVAGLATV